MSPGHTMARARSRSSSSSAIPASRVLASLVGLALAPGCYLSHERADVLRGAPDAPDGGLSARDGGVPSVRDAGPDAAPRAPCVWWSVPPWQLTSPPGDQRHHDVLAVPDGFLVAYGSSNDPPAVPGRFVAHIDLEGPRATTVLFGTARGTFLGGVGLALGARDVLAVTWDDAGCLTRLVTHEGRPLAEAAGVDRRSCVAPYVLEGAWAFFDRPGDAPASVVALDESGTRIVTDGEPMAVLEDAFWWTRVRHADGSMLVVGMSGGVEPTRAVAQRLEATGRPRSPPVELPAFGAASRVRAVATAMGALVGWLEAPDGDPTSQERELRVFPVDLDGRPLAEPRVVSTLPAYRDAGLSFASAGGDLWASYVESEPGDRFGRHTRLVALRLSDRGEPLERFTLAEGEFLRAPVVRAHDADAVVVYTSLVETANQVSVAGLVCGVGDL